MAHELSGKGYQDHGGQIMMNSVSTWASQQADATSKQRANVASKAQTNLASKQQANAEPSQQGTVATKQQANAATNQPAHAAVNQRLNLSSQDQANLAANQAANQHVNVVTLTSQHVNVEVGPAALAPSSISAVNSPNSDCTAGAGGDKSSSKPKWHQKRSNSIHVSSAQSGSQDTTDQFSIDFSSFNDCSFTAHSIPTTQRRSPGQVVHNFPSAPYKRLKHPEDRNLCLVFFSGVAFCFVSIVVGCPIILFLCLILPLVYFARKLFLFCCCCLKPGTCACCCTDLMSDTELLWFQTSQNTVVVQCLITLQHGLNTYRIQDLLNARLVSAETKNGTKQYPRFSQKVVSMPSGYAWVKDSEFDMENHVFNVPNSVQSTEDLQEYVADMASKPLAFDHPLWEIHVLTNFGEARETKLLFRIHPCVSDGISLIRILFKGIVDHHSLCNLKPRYASSVMCLNTLRLLLSGPLVFLQKWLCLRRDFNLLHGDHIHLSGKMAVAWSEAFSLPCAQRIKQVARASLNDVLMSVAAGCLRTYLQYNGVHNPYDIKVVVPVDLRTDKSTITMGNKYSYLNVSLPANTEGIVPRLWEFKLRMDDAKNSVDSTLISSLSWLSAYILSGMCFKRFWRTYFNKFTCFMTNLPGPECKLTFASREIKNLVYWVPPRDEMAVSVSFMTYGDELRMSVIADRSVIPHPELLTREFITQMNILSKLLANRRLPGEHISKRLEAMHVAQTRLEDPTMEEIHSRMSEIQQHLQELKMRLDVSVERKYPGDDGVIIQRIEDLKGEFRELMSELRHRRMSEGSSMLSDEEEEEEEEIMRRPFRKRTLSVTSRQSTTSVGSMCRPLTTSPAPHQPFIPNATLSAGTSLASVHEEGHDIQKLQIHTYCSQHTEELISPEVRSGANGNPLADIR